MSKIRQKSDYESRGIDIHTYPNQYKNADYGVARKPKTKNVVIKSSGKDKTVYGYKTIEETTFTAFCQLNEVASKWRVEFDDGTHEIVIAIDRQLAKAKLTNKDKKIKKIVRVELGVVAEATEKDTRYPESIVSEISGLIRKGAKDLEQKWKNTFELVHTAFHVANVKRPSPEQKGAWKQYEELLAVAVKALRQARGAGWEGRSSSVGWHPDMAIENQTPELDAVLMEALGNRRRRIFVRVQDIGYNNTVREHEVEAADIDEVIQPFVNQAKRNGRKVKIEPTGQGQVRLTVYVQGVSGKTREEKIINIKDWSL